MYIFCCNPYVSGLSFHCHHCHFFCMSVTFVVDSFTDFAFNSTARFIRKLRMRDADVAAAALLLRSVVFGGALLPIVNPKQKQRAVSAAVWQQVCGLNAEEIHFLAMTSKLFLGIFWVFLNSILSCILRISEG